jgi:curved DNA-binding protein
MQFKDYYEILGVGRTASADEVKRAYRKLARKFHPDVSKEKNAEDKFKEVQEAYEVLKDAEKRAAYDQLGRDFRAGQQFRRPNDWEQRFQTGGAGHGFSEVNGFSDFFSSLFGSSSGPAQPDAEAGSIEVSVEEAYAGTRRRVTVSEQGRARTVDVQIPAGVGDGQALRIGGSGRQALLLRIKIQPHPLFALQGKDVTVELPLAPWEAALGAKVTVPTLGGSVELTIPAGAQSGQKLRLRGRGLPGTPAAGDQFVSLKMVTPGASSPEAKAAYERMKKDLDFNPRAHWPEA